jgi:hypothetical protein
VSRFNVSKQVALGGLLTKILHSMMVLFADFGNAVKTTTIPDESLLAMEVLEILKFSLLF